MMKKVAPLAVLLALAVTIVLTADRHEARAEGSGGTGGEVGELHGTWDPSEYYLYVPATYNPDVPIRFFATLHGDEGDPALSILYWWPPLWEARRDFILLVPRAPYADGSWWRDVENHDVWLTSLIDYLLGLYNIEMTQMHLYGHSGGATFLGIYAVAYQDRYASVGCCIGGNPAYGYVSDPPIVCRIPARIVTGTEDFLLDMCRAQAEDYRSHGHEVELIVQEGVGHDVTEECLTPMMAWLFERTLCTSPDVPDDTIPDAAADPEIDSVPDLPPELPPDMPADVPVDTAIDTIMPDVETDQADTADLPGTDEGVSYDYEGECACTLVM